MPYLGVLVTALLVTAIVDIARSDEPRIRAFSRTHWTLLVVLAPVAGALAWFIAGRPSSERVVPASTPLVDHAAEDEFRRQCRERAEMQRRAARAERDNAPD